MMIGGAQAMGAVLTDWLVVMLGRVVQLVNADVVSSMVVRAQTLTLVAAWILGLLVVGVHVMLAFHAQARFVQAAREQAKGESSRRAAYWGAEMASSPVAWPIVLVRWLFKGRRPKATPDAETGDTPTPEGAAQPESAAPPPSPKPETPFVAPAIGASFLEAAVVVAALVVIARVIAPLVAIRLGVPAIGSLWLYLLLGNRLWASFLLSVGQSPAIGIAIAFVLLTPAWYVMARLIRWFSADALVAHPTEPDERRVPRRWWQWWGHSDVTKTDESYARWAGPLALGLGVLLLAGAVLMGDGTRGTTPIGMVVAVLLAVGWWLNLALLGQRVLPADEVVEAPAVAVAPPPRPGWDAFCAQLQQRHGVVPGLPERDIARGQLAIGVAAPDAKALSPLLVKEYAVSRNEGDPGCQPNALQAEVLARLVPAQAGGKAQRPAAGSELEISFVMPDIGDIAAGESVLFAAPDGGGKSVLCQLAAVNFAILTGKSVLIVVPDATLCRSMVQAIQARLDGSPLRWTLTCVDARQQLAMALDQGNVPDIVVCDLDFVATRLVAQPDEHTLLFSQLGLLVVDGIDRLRGRAEAHVPFAFFRLHLAVQRTLRLPPDGDAPWQCLATVADLSTATWRWAERMLRRSLDYVAASTDQCCLPVDPQTPNPLFVIDGSGFVDRDDQPLSVRDLVLAAEAAGVTWCMRSTGDDDSHMAGVLRDLSSRPWAHRVNHVLDATIVIIEGRYTSIAKEIERVELTGLRRLNEPVDGSRVCTVFTLTDTDDRVAYYVSDPRSSQHRMLQGLPQTLTYTARGEVAEAHLAAELMQNELEMKAILDGFGHGPLLTLGRLARRNALSIRTTTALSPVGNGLEEHVFIKARASAIVSEHPADGIARDEEDDVRLPRPVNSVRHVGGIVALRIMGSMQPLEHVDPYFALFRLYPDATIEIDDKTWIVRGRDGLLLAANQRSRNSAGDIRLEALSEHVVSVPRRTLWLLDDGRRSAVRSQQLRLGIEPLHIRAGQLRVAGIHHATEHLDPITFESMQQRVPGETHAVYGDGLVTNVLIVDLAALRHEHPDQQWLTHRARAVVTSAVRMSLGIIYSGGGRALDVALCALCPPPSAHQPPVPESRSWLAIMDASSGGSGAVTALERDGLETLLRLSRMVLERLLSHDRLLGRWGDFWPDAFPLDPPDASLAPGVVARQVRSLALGWLNERLRTEYSTDDRFRSLISPVGYEMGAGLDGDWGRAWFAREGGLARLKWARLGWRHPNGQSTYRADFGVDREWLGQGRPVTIVAPAPVGFAGEEISAAAAAPIAQEPAKPAARPKGCLPGMFGIFGHSEPAAPVPVVAVHEDDADASPDARTASAGTSGRANVSDDQWIFGAIPATAYGFASTVEQSGECPPGHEYIDQILPDLDQALRRTDALLEPLALLLLAEVERRSSDGEDPAVWMAAVHAAMIARSLNRPRVGAPARGDLVEALLVNEASTAPRACLLAALVRQWGLPCGFFISQNGRRVLGAMPILLDAHEPEAIIATIIAWRRTHWSIDSDGARRLLHEPVVFAVPPDANDCLMVAVDFVPDVWLSALTAADLDDWYYVPLRPLGVERPVSSAPPVPPASSDRPPSSAPPAPPMSPPSSGVSGVSAPPPDPPDRDHPSPSDESEPEVAGGIPTSTPARPPTNSPDRATLPGPRGPGAVLGSIFQQRTSGLSPVAGRTPSTEDHE